MNFLTIPDIIKYLIDEFLSENDHIVLALSCKQLYWEKWDIVGCYTCQIYSDDEEKIYDFIVETWYKEPEEYFHYEIEYEYEQEYEYY